jgi:hypothetical protein
MMHPRGNYLLGREECSYRWDKNPEELRLFRVPREPENYRAYQSRWQVNPARMILREIFSGD